MTLEDRIAQKIRASFARQRMMDLLQARLTDIAPGQVVITAPVLAQTAQQHGFAHAAVPFAIGDSAAGYAALTVMAEQVDVVTAEMKINLLAPAMGDRLEARGSVIRAGRRLVVVGAVVTAVTGDDRRDIAVLQGTMVPA